MPSAIKRFFNFSKKRGHHHGSKYHDYHGYDNLRHSAYPTTPPNNMGQPQQQQQQQQQHPYHQQPHLAPVPHSLSQHRQQHEHNHIHNQQQQQINVQAPFTHQQVISPTVSGQCLCQLCSSPQNQIYPQQSQLTQLMSQPAVVTATPAPTSQLTMANAQHPVQPVALHMQPIVTSQTHMPQQQHQQQQQYIQPLQLQPASSMSQHNHHCQSQAYNHANQMTNSFIQQQHQQQQQTQPQPQIPLQCMCQHCPIQQHQHQNHHDVNHCHQQNNLQQQVLQPLGQQQTIQQVDLVQSNNNCQHYQAVGVQLHPTNQQPTQHYHNTCNHTSQQPHTNLVCPSFNTHQPASIIASPSNPNSQQEQHPVEYTQMQSQPPNDIKQFHYHTIQPHQYQQQKQQQLQQQQQQQQHHRVHSLHQQTTQADVQQHFSQPFDLMQQPFQSEGQSIYEEHRKQSQQQQLQQPQQKSLTDSRSQEFSRYANAQSIMDESMRTNTNSQSEKYHEHVYYNQKPELPTYKPPPDYNTFMISKQIYTNESNGQSMTYHSESQASQRTKDSSYENLPASFPPYSNLGIGRRHELGLTS